nr:protein yippee-like 3 isoform X3 [Pongo abelii]
MCVAQVLTAHLLPPRQALGSLCSPWAAPRVGPLPPAPAMVRISKPKTFQAYLDDCHRRYSCAHCRAHLANHDDLISKGERGLRASRGAGAADRPPCCRRHPLRELQDHFGLEI